MFKHLSVREQLTEARRENNALRAWSKVLEDAIIELADVITENEEKEEEEPDNG